MLCATFFKVDCQDTVVLQERHQHEALVAARSREETEEFKLLYAKRAGIEETISVGVWFATHEVFGDCEIALAACAMNLVWVAD
jgi:hypothetical protein